MSEQKNNSSDANRPRYVLYVEDEEADVKRLTEEDGIFHATRSLCEIVHVLPPLEGDREDRLQQTMDEINSKIGDDVEESDISFIIVDLAMGNEELIHLQRWFHDQDWPLEPPREICGGLAVIDRLLRKTGWPAKKLAVLSSLHTEDTPPWRDLNQLSKRWWGKQVPAAAGKGDTFQFPAYEKEKTDLERLKTHVEKVCGVLSRTVLCVSDNAKTIKLMTESVADLDRKMDGFRVQNRVILAKNNLLEAFSREIEERPPFDYAVVDITLRGEDDGIVQSAIDNRQEPDDSIRFKRFEKFQSIEVIKKLLEISDKTCIIALTEISGRCPALVKWFMQEQKVSFVIDVEDVKHSMFGALWHFANTPSALLEGE